MSAALLLIEACTAAGILAGATGALIGCALIMLLGELRYRRTHSAERMLSAKLKEKTK